MTGKTVSHSQVIMSNVMLPQHANQSGNVHGGEIMKMMDSAAGVVARRHSRSNVVTARVDELEFHLPVHIGNVVTCYGKLTFVGKSSMEISVTVTVEDVRKDEPAQKALSGILLLLPWMVRENLSKSPLWSWKAKKKDAYTNKAGNVIWPISKSSCQAISSDHGLKVDGIVGPLTYQALRSDLPGTTTYTVKPGDIILNQRQVWRLLGRFDRRQSGCRQQEPPGRTAVENPDQIKTG